jgi:hypothetical protein
MIYHIKLDMCPHMQGCEDIRKIREHPSTGVLGEGYGAILASHKQLCCSGLKQAGKLGEA